MKFEQEILAAFARLNFTPRPGQAEAINKILTEFLIEKKQNVILSAPTGTGKSIIGIVVAETLSTLSGNTSTKSSIILSATNMLLNQYDESFSPAMPGKFIMIKGANNYNCSALSQPGEPENAEACAFYDMVKNSGEFSSVLTEHCESCTFLKMKQKKNDIRHLTTNYSYYFVDRMYTGKFEDRDIVVWDEAHLINDLFSEHNSIYFSQQRIQGFTKEIADTVKLTDVEISKSLLRIAADCAIPGKINQDNYKTYLTALQKIYSYAKKSGLSAAEVALRSGKINVYSKLQRFAKKYEGLACKIDDLMNYNYDHVFEYKEDDASVCVKPIFVSGMFDALKCSKYNLFMSATVNSEFLHTTLDLDRANTSFIKLDPVFPPENKEVVFFNTQQLSYASLQQEKTVEGLKKSIVKIVKKHTADGERGVILAPSFKLQGHIVAELKKNQPADLKIFEHRQGEKLEVALSAFKKYTGGPAVFISPAIFEGIDLPHDLSRYQVIVKAPYPSLAEKRMKFIMEKHSKIYTLLTTMKCVQGIGRSVRAPDDHAITYVLDTNAQRLLQSSDNIWRDEFEFKFKSMI